MESIQKQDIPKRVVIRAIFQDSEEEEMFSRLANLYNCRGEQGMTEEERKEIDPELCAEGLRYILQKYNLFDYAETAVLVGAIALLRDNSDNYPYQKADDLWKKRIID